MLKDYLKPLDFAERFDLSPSTVNKWIREGRIKALKFEGQSRSHYRIPLSEVDRIEKSLSTIDLD